MAWSFLQSASATNSGSGNVSVAYGTNLTAGSKLIALTAVSGAPGAPVVSDGTNTFTQLADFEESFSTEISLFALDCPAADAGTKPTITATIGTNYGATIIVQEVSGLLAGNTTAMTDGTAASAGGTASPATTGSYSSAAAGEYLIACYSDAGNSVTLTTPSGWTADPHNVQSSSLADGAIFYKNSAGGAESASVTLSAAATWATLLVAFKLGTSGPVTSGPALTPGNMGARPAVIVSRAGWRGAHHSR
jgi:hypothetical protein